MTDFVFTVEENANGRFGLKVCYRNGELYRYYASVSDNRYELEALALCCAEGNISALHIDDVICDFLCQTSKI